LGPRNERKGTASPRLYESLLKKYPGEDVNADDFFALD
jgi:hypothetical protein